MPYYKLPENVKNIILYGNGGEMLKVDTRNSIYPRSGDYYSDWEGVVPSVMRRWRESGSEEMKASYERYMSIDVCPVWISSFESDNTRACALESTHKKGFDKLNAITMEMMKDKLEKAAEKGRIGRPVRVMVVGAPNTGKSTIINALAGRKAAVTGDKPGVTKDFKWIMTGGRLELMDMAGVLWPRIANAKSGICLTALGSVKEEITDVVKVAYETMKIMIGIYPDLISERYGVDVEIKESEDEGYYQDPYYDLFLAMAKKRGCIMSGGRIDEERFARLFLNDLREGRMGRITLELPEDFK